MALSPLCRMLLMITSLYSFAFVFMIFLCAVDVPSPIKWNPKVWCPWFTAFLLIPDVCPVALDVISIPQWLALFANNRGAPFFLLCAIRNHTHFSGARSPPVTWSRSRKTFITTCIWSISSTSSIVRSVSSNGTGSLTVSLDVTPVVVSTTNETHGLVFVVMLSTDTSVMQSNFPPSAVMIRWFSSAHRIYDLQLPWPISYSSLYTVSTGISCFRYAVSCRYVVFQLFPRFSKHPHQVLGVSQSSDGGQIFPDDYPVVTAFSFIVKNNSISSLLDKDLNREKFVEYRRNERPVGPSILMIDYYPFVVLRQFCHVSREWCS
jgi:hypothetical protein